MKKVKLVKEGISVRVTYRGGFKFLSKTEPEWVIEDDKFEEIEDQIEGLVKRGILIVEEEVKEEKQSKIVKRGEEEVKKEEESKIVEEDEEEVKEEKQSKKGRRKR